MHVIPTGSIYITQGSKQIEVIPVNPTKGNILPDSGRFYTADWKSGFPVYEPKVLNGATLQKNGQTDYQLSWKFNNLTNLRFGRYSAHLTMVYDDGKHDVALDANVSFWVIPWRLIGIFIGIPLAMIGTIIYLVVSRRHYKRGVRVRQHHRLLLVTTAVLALFGLVFGFDKVQAATNGGITVSPAYQDVTLSPNQVSASQEFL